MKVTDTDMSNDSFLKISQDVQDTYASNSKQIDIVTAGCTYRGSTSLTVHGKVTDFQMWGKALPDEELVKVPHHC